MQHFKFRKGLDLPLEGAPVQKVSDGPEINTVAILGFDYIGLKPRLAVQEGDKVGIGSPILAHKDTPDVQVVSPVTGVVKAINRGARRALISVEIEVKKSGAKAVDFSKVGNADDAEGIAKKLCAAGLWTSFRTRPYSKVPDPETRPAAIYVTAMDTEPLAPDAGIIIEADKEAFEAGLEAIAKLSEKKTFVCHEQGVDIPGEKVPGVTQASFSGPHPAGLPGTHMHFLEPPSATRTVWTIWYQDVIAIGHLMMSGKYNGERTIAVTGPLVKNPRLVKTVAGASMYDLTAGEIDESVPERLISGSILSGNAGHSEAAYLGRYARQITVIEEDQKQITLGWIRPMADKFAIQPVLGSAFSKKLYKLTSNLNGGRRAMVPIGTFEGLMPQDFLPTQLLRALLVKDTDSAQALGALELDEEDLGLVGFACPAKYEYGLALRESLEKIEKEG